MIDYITFLQGYLTALHNYSNHSFLFERVDEQVAPIIQQNKRGPVTKEQLMDTFKMWLYNSTADFFYEDHLVNYSPILELKYWQQLPHYHQQSAFVDRKVEQFFDILEVDFFAQKPYKIYPSPLKGHAVIADAFLIEVENVWYVLGMGWDD